MNIIISSKFPNVCAYDLDDELLNTSLLIVSQILCNLIQDSTRLKNKLSDADKKELYRKLKQKAPPVVWAGLTLNNEYWVSQLFLAYSNEWYYRFNQFHYCTNKFYSAFTSAFNVPYTYPHQFYNGTGYYVGDGWKREDFPFRQYRVYLVKKWLARKKRPKWTKRGAPRWFVRLPEFADDVLRKLP